MDRRSNNIAIFQDSMDMIKASQKLQQAVQLSIQNQNCMFHLRRLHFLNLENHLAKRLFHPKEASKPPLHTQKPENESVS